MQAIILFHQKISVSYIHFPLSTFHFRATFTFNFPLSTFHFPLSLSTFHFPLSTFTLSTFNFPLSTFHFPLSTFHFPLSTFHFPLSTYLHHRQQRLPCSNKSSLPASGHPVYRHYIYKLPCDLNMASHLRRYVPGKIGNDGPMAFISCTIAIARSPNPKPESNILKSDFFNPSHRHTRLVFYANRQILLFQCGSVCGNLPRAFGRQKIFFFHDCCYLVSRS
jgi:hypothetical protein